MKNVGTLAAMGVIYWIALGAATAILVSVVLGILLAAGLIFLLLRFLASAWDNTTTAKQRFDFIVAPLVASGVAWLAYHFFLWFPPIRNWMSGVEYDSIAQEGFPWHIIIVASIFYGSVFLLAGCVWLHAFIFNNPLRVVTYIGMSVALSGVAMAYGFDTL